MDLNSQSKREDRSPDRIPIDQCIAGRVYRIDSRNLSLGVYDGNGGFIGIRHKFVDSYLFTEYHFDQDPTHGTVSGQVDTGIDIPGDIPLREDLRIVDRCTRREVFLDRSKADGNGIWVFSDTHQAASDIQPVSVPNSALFDFLEKAEQELV